MTEPKHHILDIISIPSESRKGVVHHVRSYPDGRIKYAVGYLDDDDGALYREDQLQATGQRVSPEFVLEGPIPLRTVVSISSECEFPEIRGKQGVIDGGSSDDDLSVWFDDLKESFVLNIRDLTSTGKRLPPDGPQEYVSIQVSTTGGVLSEETYVVVEDVRDL